MKNPLTALEKAIGHRFRNRQYLVAALTHRSAAPHPRHYERLEFLGDAALGLLAADYLYRRFSSMPEGEMTRIRSTLINARTLRKVARSLDLPRYLLLGEAERRLLEKGKTSILADSLEALFGAVYLDGGLRALKKVFEKLLVPELDFATMPLVVHNPKGALQEWLQQHHRRLPEYRVVGVEGPDHEPLYTVEVIVEGKVLGRGRAGSKKHAETLAAQEALRRLQQPNPAPSP